MLYVGRQGYNAAECQVTLDLRTSLGQDVPEIVEAFKRDNRNGECAHLFIGGKDFGSVFADRRQRDRREISARHRRDDKRGRSN